MPDVEFSPSREFSLIRRFRALFFVPPGAATIEIGANVRRADYGHKCEYSTNILKSRPVIASPSDSEERSNDGQFAM